MTRPFRSSLVPGAVRAFLLAACVPLALHAFHGCSKDPGSGGETPRRARVALDLEPWLQSRQGAAGAAKAYAATTLHPVPGEVAEGLPGDTVLENAHVRFVLGFGSRVISPCSYDGNVIDAELRGSAEWAKQGDVLNEICLLLNVGQTFAPEYVEILEDGSKGYAVAALTGRSEVLDFLNVKQMVGSYVPAIADEVALDPDRILPVSITVYYLLGPDDRALRVLTAIRNDGTEDEFFAASHLVQSGSTGVFFNPLSGTGGFGFRSLGADNIQTTPVPFLAYIAENSSYAYVPRPSPQLKADLPVGAGAIGVSGVMASTFETLDVLGLALTRPDAMDRTPGFRLIAPGEVSVLEHSVWAGDGSLSTMLDRIYEEELGLATGGVHGKVVGADGSPVARATVSAIDAKGRALNQTRAGADGAFAMRLPAGTFTLRARHEGGPSALAANVAVTAGGAADAGTLTLPAPATLRVLIRDPAGRPVPGRVSVMCVGTCPDMPDATERDTSKVAPGGYAAILPAGADGVAETALSAGAYKLVVSRGMTWSLFPTDATTAGGLAFQAVAGQRNEFEVELAQVVDTAGALSGDFHIHAMASSDSNVGNRARVLDFLSDGLDVMVSTDHDAVTDFRPTISELGVGAWISAIIGDEITTPNIGHFNAFPLERQDDARKGGPLDWSNGPAPNLEPAQLFAGVEARYPGEQVVQINHPTSTVGPLVADLLTGQSFADREVLRMPPGAPDPVTGDTGLWTDTFTAMEVLNGPTPAWTEFRWWLTMISRGFSPTATAVTDTHGLYGDIGASPRSFVFVGEGNDRVTEVDPFHFARSVNAGRLLATNGPFFRVEIANKNGKTVSLGETLETAGSPVTARVRIQTPEWMRVDTVDLYMNVAAEKLLAEPGKGIGEKLAPTRSLPLTWSAEDLVVVTQGTRAHRRWQKTVEVELTTEVDAYVVFVVHNASLPGSMYPVLRSSVRPFGFSNPVFLDADGGGYDKPPLAALREARRQLPLAERKQGLTVGGARRLTRELIGEIADKAGCRHRHGDAHDDGHEGEHAHD